MAEREGLGNVVRSTIRDRKKALAAGGVAILIGASVALAATQSGSRQNVVAAPAALAEAPKFSGDPERARIEKVVREYILANPEIIQEAANLLRDREIAQVIDANRALYETPFGSAWAGAEDGDVVLVEFFDYACGFCRASNPDVERLLEEDSNLKVVWRDLPVLGAASVAAAEASLAAARQGRFKLFHDRMFASGTPDESKIAAVLKESGVTPAPSGEFQQEFERNLELARAVGFSGTPMFIVGDKVLQGAVGYEALKAAIEEARQAS